MGTVLSLWSSEVTIYPIYIVENNLRCVDLTSFDWIFDGIISCTALTLQLSFRLYLRCVKKINESNDHLSIKILLFFLSTYLSLLIFPLPTNAQSYTIPSFLSCSIVPTIILFDHSGVNQFFMESHPLIDAATSAIWHIMVICYIQCKNVLSTSFNSLQENVLNICRSNQIQPYPISE